MGGGIGVISIGVLYFYLDRSPSLLNVNIMERMK